MQDLNGFHFQVEVEARFDHIEEQHPGGLSGALGDKLADEEALNKQLGFSELSDDIYAESLKVVDVNAPVVGRCELIGAFPECVYFLGQGELQGFVN